MKITFSNLGAIKKTTLDLRPLTVIIGPNNSNKTYIAYSVYGLLTNLNEIGVALSDNIELELNSEIDSTYSLQIDKPFFNELKEVITIDNGYFEKDLQTFFQDSSKKIFRETKLKVDLTLNEVREKVKKALHPEFVTKKDYLFLGLKNNPLKILYYASEYWELKPQPEDRFQLRFDCINYFTSLIFPKPLLLPAERNAFVITYKMLANRRYKLLRDSQRELFRGRVSDRQLDLLKEQGDIRYPQPIEDFLDFLTDVELQKTEIKDSEERLRLNELANKIENHIQKENTTQFKSTKFGGKEIKINVKKGLDIDLYNASSSIKQLTPLLLYLRYRAREGDLLIIDEPEMNLHPESQAKLLEVLGMLVNTGVNVLLTTHSPYFMSHLNNLIAGDMENDVTREKQAKSLYLEDSRAFLKPEDVSAYEMRQNKAGNQTLHDLHDKDYGIRWDTLSDVSADIQQKFFEIYERKEKSSNGEEEK